MSLRVTATVTPAPNAVGWHRTDPTVRFGATDNGGSATINRNTDPFSAPPSSGYHPAFDRGSKAVYDEFGTTVKGSKALIDKSLALAK